MNVQTSESASLGIRPATGDRALAVMEIALMRCSQDTKNNTQTTKKDTRSECGRDY